MLCFETWRDVHGPLDEKRTSYNYSEKLDIIPYEKYEEYAGQEKSVAETIIGLVDCNWANPGNHRSAKISKTQIADANWLAGLPRMGQRI